MKNDNQIGTIQKWFHLIQVLYSTQRPHKFSRPFVPIRMIVSDDDSR